MRMGISDVWWSSENKGILVALLTMMFSGDTESLEQALLRNPSMALAK